MHKQLCGDDSVMLSFDSELKLKLWSGELDAGLPVPEDVAEPGVAGRHSARWRDHSRARPSGDFDFTLFEKKSSLSFSELATWGQPASEQLALEQPRERLDEELERPSCEFSSLFFLEKFQKTCGCSEQGRRWRSARRR